MPVRHVVSGGDSSWTFPISPFAVQAGEGVVLETPIGDTAIVKADTRQTNGSFTVVELVIGPKHGPALHTHHREDELWVVLEGEFRFKAGGAMLRTSTGGMAFGPRGTPHRPHVEAGSKPEPSES